MLRIDIQNPLSDFQMFKVDIATILSGQDIAFGGDESFAFDVNQDGTEATVVQFAPFLEQNRLTITGRNLTLSSDGSSLTGGHVSGFGYHKSGEPGSGDADISGVNLAATVLQGYIDDAVNGADRAASIVQLQDELFDNRPQKIIGSAFDDNIQGGHADDVIHAGGGNDFIFASEGNDTIYGGAGRDVLDLSQVSPPVATTSGLTAQDGGGSAGSAQAPNPDGVSVDLFLGVIGFYTNKYLDHIVGIEDVNLTNFADLATGNGAGNSFSGGGGDDTISGKGGNDTIDGQDGNDVLAGNGGNDAIIGNEGNDLIHGNAGNDSIQGDLDAFPGLIGKDTIYGGAGNDTIHGDSGRDLIFGGADNDLIDGGGGKDLIEGGSGKDIIHGEGGADEINGGANNDKLYGGNGPDAIHGGGGNDKIHGGIGNDALSGGLGNDVIDGGAGNDVETGGSGDDTFAFNAAVSQGIDEITDFSGGDEILIHAQSFADVMFLAHTDGTAVVEYGNGSISVDSVDVHDLHAVQSGGDVVIGLV
jgi:Ca2+-binding RTX toxin-like protein